MPSVRKESGIGAKAINVKTGYTIDVTKPVNDIYEAILAAGDILAATRIAVYSPGSFNRVSVFSYPPAPGEQALLKAKLAMMCGQEGNILVQNEREGGAVALHVAQGGNCEVLQERQAAKLARKIHRGLGQQELMRKEDQMIGIIRLNPRKRPRRYAANQEGEQVAEFWETDSGEYEGFVTVVLDDGQIGEEWFKTKTRNQAVAHIRQECE